MQFIQRQILDGGICVLTFDRVDSSANIFDRKTLEELEAHITAIAAEPGMDVRGLILISAKPAIFVAGADLRSIQLMSRDELRSFIELGQRTFSRIAALKIPTVAAIHGAAVGGGCEVALACDWRVASPDRATKIGLPETKLGIVPAWGGSTRLPRLVGLPAALDIILGGKTLAAKAALKKGLVDSVVPHEHLQKAALELLKKGKRPHPWTHSPTMLRIAAPLVGAQARSMAVKKTRGHYPAVERALDVVLKATTTSDEAVSQATEREAIMDLAGSPQTHRLTELFFLQERAKKLSVPNASAKVGIKSAAVIGAGVMGAAIAQWLSARGLHVILRDVDAPRVAGGMAKIAKLYAEGVKRHTFSKLEARRGMDRVSPAPVQVPLKAVDLIIEAAVEKMDTKKAIFRQLDDFTHEDCILATNTSALSITELANATRHPGRIVGIHFFNPVHQMQLVEVIVGKDTAPEVAQTVLKFVQGIGKLPVLVKDSPGFLVNRILLPYMIEAAHLYYTGSEIVDIDDAMLDYGMPMGPLRLTDEVGVDVAEDVARTLITAFPDRLKMPEILPKMLEASLLGKKSGKGFYVHKGRDASPNNALTVLRPRGNPLPKAELQQRMVLLMVNEAARCLEERIVDSADDVDFAMVMGTGYAPFRGGPLAYADSVGVAKIAEDLSRLEKNAGAYFAPCALITELAQKNQKFHELRTDPSH
jgi:3-hydroxyacyl-CoA dehydrogenase/enoyl-CoA hydratase/3-hydroxybutyryl-CoA epimerase